MIEVPGGRRARQMGTGGLAGTCGGCSYCSSAWSGLHGAVEERGQSFGGEEVKKQRGLSLKAYLSGSLQTTAGSPGAGGRKRRSMAVTSVQGSGDGYNKVGR